MNTANIDKVVSAGLEFVRALNELYGPEKSNTVWSVISETLEPDINRKLCFGMLCYDEKMQVEFRSTYKSSRLDTIRALRTAGDFDLKTANDVWRESTNRFTTVICNSVTSARVLSSALKNNYCLITP